MKWDSWKLEPHEGLLWEREAGRDGGAGGPGGQEGDLGSSEGFVG